MLQNVEESAESSLLEADVKELVQEIIFKYNLNTTANIKCSPGSETGDNYVSRTVMVDIKDNKESLHLFIKYAHDVESDGLPLDKFYSNEIYFYDVLYIKMLKFFQEQGVENPFSNLPKCYGTSKKYVIALDNAKNVGYQLFDRLEAMNDSHIVITLKALAKYHALCFAFKDQQRDRYENIASKIYNYFYEMAQIDGGSIKNLYGTVIDTFLSQLDPIKEKHISDKCKNLWEKYRDLVLEINNRDNQNLIIIKGDCWSNNVMFRYENGNKENPADVILVDWQMIGIGSVVQDVSYFFYIAACDEELEKIEHYLMIYHDELSKSIKLLGSDPEIIYPYSVFKEEWKRFSRFGYMMTLLVLKILLVDKKEAPDVMQREEANRILGKFAELKTNAEYVRRMKKLTEHFLKNDFW